MMTYEEFKEKIRDEIKDILPERYENSEVEIHTVNKNNQQLDGLIVPQAGRFCNPAAVGLTAL